MTLHYPTLAFDRDPAISAKSAFLRTRRLELQYAARLRKIAGHVGDIVKGFDLSEISGMTLMQAMLQRYSKVLEPWAEAVGTRMVTEVAARDRTAWRKVSAQIGRAIHQEIEQAPTGQVMRQLITEQVGLITSLPIEAGERVQKLAVEGLTTGRRAADISEEIMRTGEVTKSRADLIARTEVGRASSALTQARAQYIGSDSYIWRTAKDSDVRPSHRALEGKVFRWDDPPECDPGHHAHPGAIFNCRCYPEVIVPEP